ncbi:MAG: peroxide stress protein YaaA [Gammaproteobacteria bacterium]
MLTVISPAKTLDYETPALTAEFTQPAHLHQSRKLARRLREFSSPELMGVSRDIAELNHERFRRWKTPFKPDNAKQALFAFKGDVYIGLDAETMSQENIAFAQDHLRMLSGLYGVLRPLDLMQPYRLEMGTRLDTDQGNNLYQFWDTRITRTLNSEMKSIGSEVMVNLASIEYFRSVITKSIRGKIITPVFKDYKNGNYQIIGFFAKKARGLMARYIIDNEISRIDDIKQFSGEGYAYDPSISTDREWIFTRKQKLS